MYLFQKDLTAEGPKSFGDDKEQRQSRNYLKLRKVHNDDYENGPGSN